MSYSAEINFLNATQLTGIEYLPWTLEGVQKHEVFKVFKAIKNPNLEQFVSLFKFLENPSEILDSNLSLTLFNLNSRSFSIIKSIHASNLNKNIPIGQLLGKSFSVLEASIAEFKEITTVYQRACATLNGELGRLEIDYKNRSEALTKQVKLSARGKCPVDANSRACACARPFPEKYFETNFIFSYCASSSLKEVL